MIESLSIRGYRGIRELEMTNLGRVNLLVGKNNCGKTSVLEALSLLCWGNDPSGLPGVTGRRGEMVSQQLAPNQGIRQDIDITHLFNNHQLNVDASFEVNARIGAHDEDVRYLIKEFNRQNAFFPSGAGGAGSDPLEGFLGLQIEVLHDSVPAPSLHPFQQIPLSRSGGIRGELFQMFANMQQQNPQSVRCHHQIVFAESINGMELSSEWTSSVVLTEIEELVNTSLRFLEPNIERIAAAGPSVQVLPGGIQVFTGTLGPRGGFKVKLKDIAEPVPIGTLGDGIWRMLALSIKLSRAKGGVLLIDEIDTGLHYTALARVYREKS